MAGADPYLSTQVLTASPYRLHLMVVEGAIRFARLGASSLEENDLEMAHQALGKSRDFVAELLGGLKEEYEPLLAARMKQLFLFAYARLAEGDRDQNIQKVQEALRILEIHHETWQELGQTLQTVPAESREDNAPKENRAWSA